MMKRTEMLQVPSTVTTSGSAPVTYYESLPDTSPPLPSGRLRVDVEVDAKGVILLIPRDALAQHLLNDAWYGRMSARYLGVDSIKGSHIAALEIRPKDLPTLTKDGSSYTAITLSDEEYEAARAFIRKKRGIKTAAKPKSRRGK